jgi:hypothetical protein
MAEQALAAWLTEAGLRNLPFDEMVDGFSRRLNELGAPVARTFVGMNTLHPLVRARSVIWERSAGANAHFEFRHIDIGAPSCARVPSCRCCAMAWPNAGAGSTTSRQPARCRCSRSCMPPA